MRLFCYGTLQFPELLHALTGVRCPGSAALLPGYACRALYHADYPAIVRTPGARTAGVLYRGIDRRRLALLDRFEGDEYRRRQVRVRVAGRAQSAWAYVVAPSARAQLTAQGWDAAAFARDHLEDWLRGRF